MPNYKTRKDKRTTVSLRDDLHGKLRAIAFVRGPETNLRDVVDEAVAAGLKLIPTQAPEQDDASSD